MMSALRVVAIAFPGITQLDLTGPLQVLAKLPGATIDVAWHRIEPILTDSGFSILPSTSFESAPQADVLMIPGGQGALELMEDEAALAFVRRQAAHARYVTSVCTGAFVLGAAGLLRGRRATTHWASLSLLSLLGAIPEQDRVVRDGNLVTGGGVTSGIDFALVLAAEIYGSEVAKEIQLAIEYDPQPPFTSGSPAGAEVDKDLVASMSAAMIELREPQVARAAHKLLTES
ncbi:DJ-1/PfpI family protein [Nesterenkonia rhizosphaerae]|uniref:DJ-1/PfpI family protein n=1 Tax=Nesterenkonia rhizosphaerae TaxID=1348272 RepID=A0ABP9FP19_9MICC